MKSPDKIYIPLYPNYNLDGVHLADDWMYEPQKGCDNVIYIRKDALLEWAKETYLNENASAIRKVCYKQLIDKIKSL